ncbi:hypothetical protein L598_001200000080 [Mesorhizobium sp. J18]|uniref:hypothetical protein n=1 Tax=Mesorhizobium sp. J18 TaxID=935263 RepID=UPI00119A68D4|nr:hypothetical protein [Mesorhizobium sp. J18]TWG99876.1 hypothetical protein L598_001200000080 [Mesorhizobium sp. J18]
MKIQMSKDEIALLSNFMRKSDHYFEFGMGGSTCLAAELVAKSVSAIDSSIEWVQKVREKIGESPKDITLTHVDIGPIGAWGSPKGSSSKHLFPAYSDTIKQQRRDINLCLVDGRFRVACFLKALAYLDSDAVLAMHDYRVRDYYHVVEEFARPIAATNTLVFFVRRKGVMPPEIERSAASFVFDSR